ncbi:alanine racemase [Roseospira marina]|uniref:Alanine racemase n=1 Tax=Roseospira marina TaxID=140057 RepID=A0A5M6IBR6_9PROT|nr:alanine racemase [Roseospira marina]KAA5605179.1 alanine racemase [Roseospira marina]
MDALADPRAGGILTVDLGALAANWRTLRARLAPGAECGGVIKANGYGLGAVTVAHALCGAGCRTFFVAQLEEGLRVAPTLPADARVFVLSGPTPGTEPEFVAAGLIPVLNSPEQMEGWAAHARVRERALPAALHVDTGMTRLGLSAKELAALVAAGGPPPAVPLVLVMSHLACADEPGHPLTPRQLETFRAARAALPGVPGSLANSSGIFIGVDAHHDLVRPGVALYGVNPTSGRPNPMADVIRLQARVLQVRHVDAPATVGYGAGHRAATGTRIATVGVGYADGLPRASSGLIVGYIGETPVPLVGRVSMDLVTFDVSAVPDDRPVRAGDLIDLIGPFNPVDDLAARAGTIGYEILTTLGPRFARHHVHRPVP